MIFVVCCPTCSCNVFLQFSILRVTATDLFRLGRSTQHSIPLHDDGTEQNNQSGRSGAEKLQSVKYNPQYSLVLTLKQVLYSIQYNHWLIISNSPKLH